MSRQSVSSDSVFTGISLIIAAVFVHSLVDAAVKYFSVDLPLWQLFLIVSCLSVLALGAWLSSRAKTARIRIGSIRWIIIRSILLLMMWISYYSALPMIPLSVAAVAMYTAPVFLALISTRYGNEPLLLLGWAAVGIGFLGVAIVLRPGADTFTSAALLPVLSAVFYALAVVVTRRKCRNEHPSVLAFGLNIAFLVAAVIGGVVSLLVSEVTAASAGFLLSSWQPLGWPQLLFIVGYSCALVFINIATARAYQIAPSAVVGTFDYAYLAFACLWGYLLFGEIPDIFTWTGMLLILIAGLLVLRARQQKR